MFIAINADQYAITNELGTVNEYLPQTFGDTTMQYSVFKHYMPML